MDKDKPPTIVQRFMTREGNHDSVGFPLLYTEYFDKKTRTMKKYGDEITMEEIRKAKLWLKANGFIYNCSSGYWERKA